MKNTSMSFTNITTSLGLFLYGLLAPLGLLPKIAIVSFQVRLGIILVLPAVAYYIIKKAQDLKKITHLKIKLLSFIYLLYCGLNSLVLNPITTRSFGFLIWLALNLLILNLILDKPKKSLKVLINGFLIGQTISSLYLLYSVYAAGTLPLIWPIEQYSFSGMLRSGGLAGEPSYFAISIIPAIWMIYFMESNPLKWILFTLYSTAGFLSLSRLFIFSYLFLILAIVIIDRRNLSRIATVIVLVTFSLFPSILKNPRYYGIVDTKTKKEVEIKSRTYPKELKKLSTNTGLTMIDHGWNSQRIISFIRSYKLFLENPYTGVGLGNSEYRLRQKFLGKSKKHYYVEGSSNLHIEVLLEQGLIGTIVLLTLVLTLAKNYINPTHPYNIMAFIFFGFTMSFGQTITRPTILIFLASLIFFTKKADKASSRNSYA